MAAHKAHKKFGDEELEKQKSHRIKLMRTWQGKTSILATYENMGIEDDYTKNLRVECRKLRCRLVSMGAI